MAGELILIVEDNEKNLKLVRDYLQVKGYQIRKAAQREPLRLLPSRRCKTSPTASGVNITPRTPYVFTRFASWRRG